MFSLSEDNDDEGDSPFSTYDVRRSVTTASAVYDDCGISTTTGDLQYLSFDQKRPNLLYANTVEFRDIGRRRNDHQLENRRPLRSQYPEDESSPTAVGGIRMNLRQNALSKYPTDISETDVSTVDDNSGPFAAGDFEYLSFDQTRPNPNLLYANTKEFQDVRRRRDDHHLADRRRLHSQFPEDEPSQAAVGGSRLNRKQDTQSMYPTDPHW